MIMKLSTWAKKNNIKPKTAYNWFVTGKMPYPTEQIGPKTIIVHLPEDDENFNKTVIYARVSSNEQKQDLDQQVLRLTEYCVNNNIKIDEIYKEIGSGLNENRPKLNKILSDSNITNIIVEHKDRLGRHNIQPLISALKAQKRTITIIDNKEIDDDLVQDVIALMTSYAAKLHGKRSARNKANKALKQLEEDN